MKLHQINIAYDPAEDRLLMRISTTAATEYRFWLTRRMLRALGPPLLQRLQAPQAEVATPQAQEALMAFKHEAALQKTQFAEDYKPAEPVPEMADAPVLVHRVQHQRLDDGQHALALAAKEGPAARIQLSETLMHGVVKLINDAMTQAEWDLRWDLPAPTPPTAQTVM